jgi:hypothetical protein
MWRSQTCVNTASWQSFHAFPRTLWLTPPTQFEYETVMGHPVQSCERGHERGQSLTYNLAPINVAIFLIWIFNCRLPCQYFTVENRALKTVQAEPSKTS